VKRLDLEPNFSDHLICQIIGSPNPIRKFSISHIRPDSVQFASSASLRTLVLPNLQIECAVRRRTLHQSDPFTNLWQRIVQVAFLSMYAVHFTSRALKACSPRKTTIFITLRADLSALSSSTCTNLQTGSIARSYAAFCAEARRAVGAWPS
jgi:hypothetical protein